jgi:hypothetical protein
MSKHEYVIEETNGSLTNRVLAKVKVPNIY